MARRTTKPKGAKSVALGQRLIPPEQGATVRMYRTGHGDCFLLAFAGEAEDKPVYVLIDCGYKPGSGKAIGIKTVKEITQNLCEATGGYLHVAIITHEHQDHLNGITKTNFSKITVGETWLAWTEDPEDDLANGLREIYQDKLIGLLRARHCLVALGDDSIKRLDALLEFELGGDSETYKVPAVSAVLGAAGKASKSMNKQSMQVLKERASNNVKYIRPHERILRIQGAAELRIFALGPPRDAEQLKDLDPQGDEAFFRSALASASPGNYFATAVAQEQGRAPFADRFCVAFEGAPNDADYGEFFNKFYGSEDAPPQFVWSSTVEQGEDEIHANPDWRRIDNEWLYSAEHLALAMNDYTNNSSLVLAFELGKGGKVLLFAADAQRGNWASWAKKDWNDGDQKITTKDLLARTVLYKVGHHGSHNATLNGTEESAEANLAWMATGDHRREFTAMITAVRSWAEKQQGGWDHPQKAIKDALMKKASGRVFQTDTDFDHMSKPEGVSNTDWDRFQANSVGDRLYFDYTITG